MINNKKKVGHLRTVLQLSVFVFVLLISISKWLVEKGITIPFLPEASLHAICPFGGVVTIYEFITTGDFIQKIHSSSFILMSLGMVTALLFGSIFCGYICPFGTFQEWIGKIGKRLFSKNYNKFVPASLDKILRYLRYIVLVMVVYQTAVSSKLVFQSIDPYYALFNLLTNEIAVSAYIMLGVIVVLSLFIERPWCKYLCPYGALLGLFNVFRIFKIKRNQTTCIHCKICDNVCPMNIEVSTKNTISDVQCISCYQCTSDASCPIPNTVMISSAKESVTRED